MIKPAIVVICYNREKALKRLLKGIERADYPDDDVTLIISVDKALDGSSEPVVRAAEEFAWKHGEKRVIVRDENYGLKKHVLTCGDFSRDYGAIIMLEDDLYVSPAFYCFAQNALEFSEKDERIGGVSLYNHQLNVHVREPFSAIHDPFDNYYLQLASSWGQAFLAKQWTGFREWLSKNDGTDIAGPDMPRNISGWSEKSWLKYCIRYLINTGKYFLYPYISYSTNFSDEGEHAKAAVCDLQVPLSGNCGVNRVFHFAKPDETRSVYDAFFENLKLRSVVAGMVGCDEEDVTIDLYGYHMENKRYLLSSNSLPYLQIRGFARQFRPHDENIFQDFGGRDFILYDCNIKSTRPGIDATQRLLYNYKAIKCKEMIRIILSRL